MHHSPKQKNYDNYENQNESLRLFKTCKTSKCECCTEILTRDEMNMREVEELRQRSAQMEKTMRWWSDCTSSWRDKWTKVRSERNKLIEENQNLHTKMIQMSQELSRIKEDKIILQSQIEHLKSELHMVLGTNSTFRGEESLSTSVASSGAAESDSLFVDKVLQVSDSGIDYTTRNMQLQLDEAKRNLASEREEKLSLRNDYDALQTTWSALIRQCEEAHKLKFEYEDEIASLKIEHQTQLQCLTSELNTERLKQRSFSAQLQNLQKQIDRLRHAKLGSSVMKEKDDGIQKQICTFTAIESDGGNVPRVTESTSLPTLHVQTNTTDGKFECRLEAVSGKMDL